MLAGKMLLLRGAVVGDRYLVEEILGTGGFGAVYLVSDRQADGALFALKEVIEPTQYARDRLAREGELLERLQHPALPRVFRLFIDEQSERVYLLMEYIEGLDLEQVWRERPDRRFALPEVLDIIAPIIEAVAYLHRQHPPVLHRDIKPANIILRATDHTAMLVDFGIAKEYNPENTTTELRHGSPGFAAPEHYGTGTDPRTDIYGLGATVYTLLTGNVPEDALVRLTNLGNRGKDALTPMNQLAPAIPASVADAVHRALSLRQDARFETVEQFWRELKLASLENPLSATRLWLFPAAHMRLRARRVVAQVPTLSFFKRSPASRPWRYGIIPLLLSLLIGFSIVKGFWPTGVSQPGTRPATPTPTRVHVTPKAPMRPENAATPSTPSTNHQGGSHHQKHKHGGGDQTQGGNTIVSHTLVVA